MGRNFNGKKYGTNWESIDFDLNHKQTKDSEGVDIIGFLVIGRNRIPITWTEASKICNVLDDGKYTYNIAKKLGMLGNPMKTEGIIRV
tara:strand:- start:61119 stop:61382 length:264 start_codon:yes stop_codon:yes gene_type:complete